MPATKHGACLTLAIPILASLGARPAIAQDGDLIVVGATIVDLNGDSLVRGKQVLVRGGRIASVLPDSITVDAPRVVHAEGSYLVPGLFDGHVHEPLCDMPGDEPRPDGACAGKLLNGPLYLRHGVTSVLHMSGRLSHHSDDLRTPPPGRPDPSLYSVSPSLSNVSNPENIPDLIASYADSGFVLVKTHGFLGRRAFEAAHEAADREGLLVVGHAEPQLGVQASIEEGQAIAHVAEYYSAYVDTGDLVVRGSRAIALALGLVLIIAGIVGVRRSTSGFLLLCVGLIGCVAAGLSASGYWLISPPPARFAVIVSPVIVLGLAIASNLRGERPRALLSGLIVGMGLLLIPLSLQARRATEGSVEELAEMTREHDVWVGPTIISKKYQRDLLRDADLEEMVAMGRANHMSPDRLSFWESGGGYRADGFLASARNALTWIRRSNEYRFYERMTAALIHEGVHFFTGSAVGEPGTLPGRSLVEELEILESLGMPPAAVLLSATEAPAELLRLQERSAIGEGLAANFVVVGQNPLTTVSALREIQGVVARGRWWSAAELDSILAVQDAVRWNSIRR